MKKYGVERSIVIGCVAACFLLGGLVSYAEAQVTIVVPPENATVTIGSNVNISCGYQSSTALPVTWIINGTSFSQQEVVDSPLYQLNIPGTPMKVSLTVFSINDTTTFQCIIHSTPNTTSTLGIVTVTVTTVTITRPPENTTACRGSRVIINCGYQSDTVLPVTWIINGSSFTEDVIKNMNNVYRLGVPTTPNALSLTVISINGNTTFQCIVHSTLSITSSLGTVAVVADVPVVEITTATGGCGYVYVSWTVIGNNHICEIVNFHVILVSVSMSITEQISTDMSNSYNVTGLPDDTVFDINVIGSNELINTNPASTSVRTKSTNNLQNCTVTSPSVGTTRVSCDSCHQILVTLTCTNNCNISMVTSNGNSPLTVRGLDPGMMYSVIINVFDGNQVVLSNQTVTLNITVMSGNSDNGSDNNTGDSGSGTGGGDDNNNSTTDRSDTSDSDSGGSSAGAIVGGVIGGIVAVVVIVIIIIVIGYFFFYKNKDSTYDDTKNLKSPPGIGGTHASGEETNGATTSSVQYDEKVVYAAPAQTVTVPHQTVSTGDMYAVSTKAVGKASQEQPPSGEGNGVHDAKSDPPKKDTGGITYADLQILPSEDKMKSTEQDAVVTYSQIA